jgi:hypothetical protein
MHKTRPYSCLNVTKEHSALQRIYYTVTLNVLHQLS